MCFFGVCFFFALYEINRGYIGGRKAFKAFVYLLICAFVPLLYALCVVYRYTGITILSIVRF